MFYQGENVSSCYRGGQAQYGEVFIKKLLDALTLPLRAHVLDIGCGNGHFMTSVQNQFPGKYQVTGVDPSLSMLNEARINTNIFRHTGGLDMPVGLIQGFANQTYLPDQSVDLIVMGNSIHWLLQDEKTEKKTLDEMARIANHGCQAIILTHRPNKKDHNPFWGELLSALKNHPDHDGQAEFIRARERCGGTRNGMIDRFILAENRFERSQTTPKILFDPTEAADYCRSISPYQHIDPDEIQAIAKDCFDRNRGTEDFIKVSWITTADCGDLLPAPKMAATSRPRLAILSSAKKSAFVM